MSQRHAYAQDVSGNWIALRVNATGGLAGGSGGSSGLPSGQPANIVPWSYAAASGGVTDTSDVTLIAAAGAGKSNYLTSLQLLNSSATATEVVVKSGTTVLWRCKLGASMTRPAHVEFLRPLISANNTALTAACITTGTATYIDAQGYSDETIEGIEADLTAAEEVFDAAGNAIYDEYGVVVTLPGPIQDSPLRITAPGPLGSVPATVILWGTDELMWSTDYITWG